MTEIRKELPADISAIEAITVAAFRSAEHSNGTEQHIVTALREAGQLAVSLVADVDGQIVGHVAASPVSISDGSANWYGLGPVSVVPDRQGQGLGTLLVTSTLGELRALGAAGCVVLGEPSYYSRFGFSPEPRLVLPGVPAQYFQVLALQGAIPSGRVAYHASFEATS